MINRHHFSIAALAAGTLLFEGTLTRLLAVAQFYHFAFLVISLALLGFGASGTLLSVFPKLRAVSLERLLVLAGTGFAFGVSLAYAGVNWLPFDSYSIAWERRQIIYFLLYYLALTVPFLISGLGIGGALALTKGRSNFTYAANLLGSALGALLAPLMLSLAGVPGAVLMSALVGIIAALIALGKADGDVFSRSRMGLISVLCVGIVSFGWLIANNLSLSSSLGMEISPYKALSYAQQYPGSKQVYGRWNAISRLDVIENAGTRRLPGLSYQYLETPPPQVGLSTDADALQPITLTSPETFDAAAWMPEALAFALRPHAETLVGEPGGGLGVLQALAGGAELVTTLIENPSLQQAVTLVADKFDLYSRVDVRVISEPARVYLHQSREQGTFDIVFFPLTDAYRPVTSGAYSLGEDYDLTVEAFRDALARLSPDGIMVITRWLQSPPSESLRVVATMVEALDESGRASPGEALIAYRSIQTLTLLVNPDGWTGEELLNTNQFIESRRFDWVWGPGIQLEQVNRFNQLPAPVYYSGVRNLVSPAERDDFYASYPFNIRPGVDNKPFFFHFFTWSQTPEVLNTLGMTWQPFGGSGYLLLLALLVMVLILSGVLILFPLALMKGSNRGSDLRSGITMVDETRPERSRMEKNRHQEKDSGALFHSQETGRIFIYFALLGIAFLFVEIPLIQQWILLLGQQIYAFTTVVGILLLSSGLGSVMAGVKWIPKQPAFVVLVFLSVSVPLGMPYLIELVLGWPIWARLGAALVSLAPLGFLMGMPFPLGLEWLERNASGMTPWAWAINGCASVVASVLAAILTLSFGFTSVMLIGAGAYAAAYLTIRTKF